MQLLINCNKIVTKAMALYYFTRRYFNFLLLFLTYNCISNEIIMNFRKAKKRANDISIDEPIANDGEGNEHTLGDIIENSE